MKDNEASKVVDNFKKQTQTCINFTFNNQISLHYQSKSSVVSVIQNVLSVCQIIK